MKLLDFIGFLLLHQMPRSSLECAPFLLSPLGRLGVSEQVSRFGMIDSDSPQDFEGVYIRLYDGGVGELGVQGALALQHFVHYTVYTKTCSHIVEFLH